MATDLPVDLQAALDDLKADFEAAAGALVERRDERLTRFTEAGEYATHVLPWEVERLRRIGGPAKIAPPGLLVLLCGTTPQPLLVSERFLAPEKVLLAGTDTLQGRQAAEEVMDLLPHEKIIRPVVYLAERDPPGAFHALAGRLRQEMKDRGLGADRVLIDVTGGKKTMVAAAFLVASQLGLRTVYVDGEYDVRLRLPRPASLYLCQLDDPVAVFWLRQRGEALRLFDGGDYRGAGLLLDEMAKSVQDPADKARIREAAGRAHAVVDWEEADYPAAAARLGVQAAARLKALADIWRSDEDQRLTRFAKEDRGAGLLRFCADRLAWALHRRSNLRQAFLGAYFTCDAALDGLNAASGLDPKKKMDCPAVAGLRQKYGVFAKGAGPRKHRNALAHRIAAPNEAFVEQLLGGNPCLCVEFLRDVGAALKLGPLADELLKDPLADLQSDLKLLRPGDIESF